jgi:hypothetical protein
MVFRVTPEIKREFGVNPKQSRCCDLCKLVLQRSSIYVTVKLSNRKDKWEDDSSGVVRRPALDIKFIAFGD